MFELNKTSWQTDNGRIRAASRVKEKMRRDSLVWTVDGRRRRTRTSRSNKRPSGAIRTLHSAPWNERFVVQDIPERMNRTRPLSAYGKENSINITRPKTAMAAAESLKQTAKSTPSKSVRHFSERSDGELVLNYSRTEILSNSNGNCSSHIDNLLGGTEDASVSPFDMVKLKAALDAAESDNDGAEHGVEFPINSPCTKDMNPIDRNQAHANLEAFEDLLYTVEIEEELAHRELRNKTLLVRTGNSPEHGSVASEADSTSKEDGPDDEVKMSAAAMPVGRQEEIHNYVWQSNLLSREREKALVKDGSMQFHEIVQVLADSILEKCIIEIVNDFEVIVQESAEQIFQKL